jgi:DNA-binding response OmpR family regulator
MLPRRNGLDLCRDIRRAGLGMPVLMLTARRTTEDMLAGFSAGADAYVTKPFDMQELSARVETLLRRAPSVGSTAQSPSHLATVLMQQSDIAEPGTIGSQSRSQPQHAVRLQKLRADLVERFATPGNTSRLAEVTFRLRNMRDEEPRGLQTQHNAVTLGTAEGIIEFLEEMLQAVRTWRKTRSREN